MPLMRALPSFPVTSPKPCLLIPSVYGVRISTYEFWVEGTRTFISYIATTMYMFSCLLVEMGGIINIVGSKMSTKASVHLDTVFCSCMGDRCHMILKAHEKANGVFQGQNGMGEKKMVSYNLALEDILELTILIIPPIITNRQQNMSEYEKDKDHSNSAGNSFSFRSPI